MRSGAPPPSKRPFVLASAPVESLDAAIELCLQAGGEYSAGDAAEWDETTGEWFFRKPPGGPGAGRKGAKWDTKTGEWVGGSKPTKRAAPAAAAPAPKKQKESQARHAFAVGDEVEALWDEKWWKAVVHDLRDDGSYEVHWDGMEVYDFVAANAVRAVPDAVRAVPWGAWGGLGRIFGK